MLTPNEVTQRDEQYMRRCFSLARLGRPLVKTNPLVGCCIVYRDRIIGEGFHHQYGEHHAEVDAIKNIHHSDLQYLQQSTLYVSLTPCNHHGKTPACSGRIIELQIPRVVIGMNEINPTASGGIKKLRDAGVEVKVGVLEKEAEELVQAFSRGITKNRPYITLKWAQTANGWIGIEGAEVKISSQQSQLKVHDLRRQHNAILVGAGTVLADNPELTTRAIPGLHPLRVVILGERDLPANTALLTDEHHTLIFSTKDLVHEPLNEHKRLVLLDEINLPTILSLLYTEYQIGWLLVEGGRHVLNQFIHQDLYDEIWRITSSTSLSSGIPAPVLTLAPTHTFNFGSDRFHIYH